LTLDSLFSQSTSQCAYQHVMDYGLIVMNVDIKYLVNTKFGKSVQLVIDVTVPSIRKYIDTEALGRTCLLKNISRLELEKNIVFIGILGF